MHTQNLRAQCCLQEAAAETTKDTAPAKSGAAFPDMTADAKSKEIKVDAKLVLQFSGGNADNVTVNVWDCGGQPVFDSIHDLFISGSKRKMQQLFNRMLKVQNGK